MWFDVIIVNYFKIITCVIEVIFIIIFIIIELSFKDVINFTIEVDYYNQFYDLFTNVDYFNISFINSINHYFDLDYKIIAND